MIKPEVKDLIQELWLECDEDLEIVLDHLGDTELEREAASLVSYILKHGVEEWAE